MYRKIKITFYLVSFLIIIYFYVTDGVQGYYSHTPPPAFFICFGIFIISILWLNVDYICSNLLTLYKTKTRIHYLAILLSIVTCVLIIYEVL
jgi:hypothetical protein